MSTYTVSELAKQVGATADTLRYYERIGLLPEPPRTAAGYRQYGPEDAERLRFIKRAQRFGLRLEDIGELLRIREEGLCPCGRTRNLLAERLAELDAELDELRRLREDVVTMLDELPETQGSGWACCGAPVPLSDEPPEGAPS